MNAIRPLIGDLAISNILGSRDRLVHSGHPYSSQGLSWLRKDEKLICSPHAGAAGALKEASLIINFALGMPRLGCSTFHDS